jgi:hypothetical protein
MVEAVRSAMLEFLGFALDCNGGGLFQLDDWRLPIPVPLGWRALEVLSVLVERRGTIVSRKEIIDAGLARHHRCGEQPHHPDFLIATGA